MLHDEVRALADVVSPADHDRVMAIADEVEAVETALREIEELPGLLPPPKTVAEWGRLAGVEEAADIARTARAPETGGEGSEAPPTTNEEE